MTETSAKPHFLYDANSRGSEPSYWCACSLSFGADKAAAAAHLNEVSPQPEHPSDARWKALRTWVDGQARERAGAAESDPAAGWAWYEADALDSVLARMTELEADSDGN